MSFKDNLSSDMAVFLNSDEFGESITYTPHGGSPISIVALIDRDHPNPGRDDVRTDRQFPVNTVQLTIAKHATLGVASVKERFDRVALKRKISDAGTTTFTITRIVEQDEGAWLLEAIV